MHTGISVAFDDVRRIRGGRKGGSFGGSWVSGEVLTGRLIQGFYRGFCERIKAFGSCAAANQETIPPFDTITAVEGVPNMPYRCETASVNGFVQQLACNLVNNGYWFYVVGEVPRKKDPAAVDAKLIDMYGLDQSKWARARRKAKGLANVAYLRYGRFFLLLTTAGEHTIYHREGAIRDIRRQPIRFHGYSIGCRRGTDGRYHSSVQIDPDTFTELRDYLLGLTAHRSPDNLEHHLRNTFPFMPYARVRRQILRLVREVNEARRTAGFEPVEVPNMRRIIVRPFAEGEVAAKNMT